jgi:hypothetical protein
VGSSIEWAVLKSELSDRALKIILLM